MKIIHNFSIEPLTESIIDINQWPILNVYDNINLPLMLIHQQEIFELEEQILCSPRLITLYIYNNITIINLPIMFIKHVVAIEIFYNENHKEYINDIQRYIKYIDKQTIEYIGKPYTNLIIFYEVFPMINKKIQWTIINKCLQLMNL